MAAYSRTNRILGISFVLWATVMGLIIHAHYIKHVDEELGYFSSDVVFDSETISYFSIRKDNHKIGYKIIAEMFSPGFKAYQERSTVKLNLAGMSREVFITCTVGIDSTFFKSKYMEFTLQSGTHVFHSTNILNGDSLYIDVKLNNESPWRKGVFIVDENMTYPATLPFFINRSKADTMSISVFDPFIFTPYNVHITRKETEILEIKGNRYDAVKYDLNFLDKSASIWLDKNGRMVKSSGYFFFSGILGDLEISKAMDEDVFLLPLEVTLGKDVIKNTLIYPDKPIPEPRNAQYLEIELEGVRAANIDVSASNKELLSLNPVVLGIHNRPILKGKRMLFEMKIAAYDTAIVGTSDYIQTTDARMERTARQIIASEPDTLTMARKINQWVFSRVKKVTGLDIIRSTDILREMRGDSDEHTKLFTALTRSIGIPTQIYAGLVYKEGAFRYHSWPSVFTRGVWHDMDPTFGQDAIDATHIALVRGDFERLVELVRLSGRISIKIIEYR